MVQRGDAVKCDGRIVEEVVMLGRTNFLARNGVESDDPQRCCPFVL